MKKIKRFLTNVNSAVNKDYSRVCKNEIYRAVYEFMAHSNNDNGVASTVNGEEIIISLTTYGERIYSVHKTIESLMQQTHKANRIILWLDQDEFSLDTIPDILINMMDRGLEIKFCPNYKSYKKLIPTLQLTNQSNIITVDDDMIYPLSMIENMYRTHCKYPDCIVFNYGTEITLDKENHAMPYTSWRDQGDFSTPSLLNMGIGVGGIWYPKDSLHPDVTDIATFETLAPKADDLWFKIMSYRNGTKQVQTNFGLKILNSNDFLNNYITIEDEQRERLGVANVINKENDIQLAALVKKYNINFNLQN